MNRLSGLKPFEARFLSCPFFTGGTADKFVHPEVVCLLSRSVFENLDGRSAFGEAMALREAVLRRASSSRVAQLLERDACRAVK